MNREHLERGKRVILELIERKVPEVDIGTPDFVISEGFDIAMWGYTTECGTVGCIAGWMTLDPQLHSEGLRNEDAYRQNESLMPIFGELEEVEALATFFDIPYEDADYVFNGDNPNSLHKAVERIQNVLDSNSVKRKTQLS